mgnify:FL=1
MNPNRRIGPKKSIRNLNFIFQFLAQGGCPREGTCVPKIFDHVLFGGGITMRERTVWSQSVDFRRTKPFGVALIFGSDLKSQVQILDRRIQFQKPKSFQNVFSYQRSNHFIHLRTQAGSENYTALTPMPLVVGSPPQLRQLILSARACVHERPACLVYK